MSAKRRQQHSTRTPAETGDVAPAALSPRAAATAWIVRYGAAVSGGNVQRLRSVLSHIDLTGVEWLHT